MWRFLFKKLPSNDKLFFNENECLYNNGATCTACVEICPSNAFQLKDGRVIFDISSCEECKLCVHTCPIDAIHIESEMLLHYEKKIMEQESICFTCPLHVTSDTDIVVPCLSIISPELVLIAVNHHKDVQIFFRPSNCQSCKLGWRMKHSIKYLQELNYITRVKVEIIHEEEEKVKPLSLSLWSFLLKTELHSMPPQKLPRVVYRNRRSYLVEYVKNESHGQFISLRLAKALRLTKCKVSKACQLCGHCVEVCPVNAIDFINDKGVKILVFKPIKCIGCGLCEKNCINISLEQETRLSKYLLNMKLLKNE